MPRAGEARLHRLEAGAPPPPEAAARDRRGLLRWEVAMGAMIRAAAVAAGIEPGTIGALRISEEAAAELLVLGDTPELTLADAAASDSAGDRYDQHPGEPDPRQDLAARLERIGRFYLDGSRPAAGGSFMEWLAWALLQEALPQ